MTTTTQEMTDITNLTDNEVAALLNVTPETDIEKCECLFCGQHKTLTGSFCDTCTDTLSCIKRYENNDPYNAPFSVKGLVKHTTRNLDEAYAFMKAFDKL